MSRTRRGGRYFEVIYLTQGVFGGPRRLSLSLARKDSCGNLAVSIADGPDSVGDDNVRFFSWLCLLQSLGLCSYAAELPHALDMCQRRKILTSYALDDELAAQSFLTKPRTRH